MTNTKFLVQLADSLEKCWNRGEELFDNTRGQTRKSADGLVVRVGDDVLWHLVGFSSGGKTGLKFGVFSPNVKPSDADTLLERVSARKFGFSQKDYREYLAFLRNLRVGVEKVMFEGAEYSGVIVEAEVKRYEMRGQINPKLFKFGKMAIYDPMLDFALDHLPETR